MDTQCEVTDQGFGTWYYQVRASSAVGVSARSQAQAVRVAQVSRVYPPLGARAQPPAR